jgi:predicted enzyme related to lactoylglutathione lyase
MSYLRTVNCAWLRLDRFVQDVYKTAESIKAAGGRVTREPGPLPGRPESTHITVAMLIIVPITRSWARVLITLQ